MNTVLVAVLVLLLAGCSALPSMRYCDHIEYVRDGSRITVKAECMAPVGGGLP